MRLSRGDAALTPAVARDARTHSTERISAAGRIVLVALAFLLCVALAMAIVLERVTREPASRRAGEFPAPPPAD
jgi:hypothetical protein